MSVCAGARRLPPGAMRPYLGGKETAGGSSLTARLAARKIAPASRRPAAAARRTLAAEAISERILDAALGIFSAYGFHGARVDQIAAAAGMSKPNLLYYCRSKENLYTTLMRRTLTMWLEPLRELDEQRDPREALAEYISRKLEYSRDNPEASRLFAIEILQGAPRLTRMLEGELAEIVAEKSETIRRWVAAGRLAPIDPHHLIFAIWATTQHYADFQSQVNAVTGTTINQPDFFAATRENLVAILLDGVLPRGRS